MSSDWHFCLLLELKINIKESSDHFIPTARHRLTVEKARSYQKNQSEHLSFSLSRPVNNLILSANQIDIPEESSCIWSEP
jgi:hypothetical protein